MNFNMVVESWLEKRHISKEIQDIFHIKAGDNNIVIPVHDEQGNFVYNKYRRSPLTEDGSKYFFDKGSKICLYAWDKAKEHKTILITEGEFDCLVAWKNNIPATTSTGGAMSFQQEWTELFKDKEVIVCFDNDEAGAQGMVKVLGFIPHAKILFLPDRAGIKDISDYAMSGGDLNELLKTAKHYSSIADVSDDRYARLALWKSTYFHDEYIKTHTKRVYKGERKSFSSDEVTNANLYPISNLLEFRGGKCRCPFHSEKTSSFVYYEDSNRCYCFGSCGKAYDAIAIYRNIHKCTFKKAVDELNKIK